VCDSGGARSEQTLRADGPVGVGDCTTQARPGESEGDRAAALGATETGSLEVSANVPERALPLAEELAGVFTQMSGLLLSQETVDTALHTVATLAQATLAGTVAAGVTLVDTQGRKTTAAASDALAERADALQYELDEGPCLTAWAERTLVRVDDVDHDERWPRWTSTPAAEAASDSAPG
jgi:hypothetical protein